MMIQRSKCQRTTFAAKPEAIVPDPEIRRASEDREGLR